MNYCQLVKVSLMKLKQFMYLLENMIISLILLIFLNEIKWNEATEWKEKLYKNCEY